MAKKTDIGSSGTTQYTRSYGDLRGVDLSSDPAQVNMARPSYLVNMYRDYESEHGAAIETIPGFRRLFHFDGAIHGIWGYSSSQDETAERYAVVHAGTKLYTFKTAERDSGDYVERFSGLCDGDSSAFLQNNNFYICDGKGIYVMKADFSVVPLTEDAYVPISYLHGAPYEQRNMLCDKFINKDTAVVSGQYPGERRGGCSSLEEFKEKNFQNFTYEEAEPEDYESEETIDGVQITIYETTIKYYITGYSARAFDELDLVRAVSLASSYTEKYDGGESRSYTTHVVAFDPKRFLQKDKIKRVIKPAGRYVETYTFPVDEWPELDEIYSHVMDYDNEKPVHMYEYHEADVVICDPCISLTSVKVRGVEIPSLEEAIADGRATADGTVKPDIFYLPVKERFLHGDEENWYISFIHIYAKAIGELNALDVDIEGVAAPVKMEKAEDVANAKHTAYIHANTEYKGTSIEAILGCPIATTFDGRVFLTGNPNLPNTVFYSCRDLTGYNNPAYWGVYNYFNDGEGNDPNVALLATSSILMVLKNSTVQGSSIYYHTGADGIDDVVPRVYPSTPGVAGIGCVGSAINFLDDAVFLSERGLEGISKEQLNLERTIGHRSSNVDRILIQSDLGRGRLCRWGGYLCLFTGDGRLFLGDSRQLFQGVDGAMEYEWYSLEGIGDFEGDWLRHRTLTQFPEVFLDGVPDGVTLEGATILGEPLLVDGESAFVDADALYTGVASVVADGVTYGVTVKYIERDGSMILCDSDGEREGGVFSPACCGYSIDGLLLFGTAGGSICCFNTDKRWTGLDADGGEVEKGAIHRSWYTFVGHRYLSGLSLKSDNCGVPHLTKRTVRKSCVMKLKTMKGASVNVRIRTDREPWHEVTTSFAGTDFDFSEMEFDNFSFHTEDDTIVTVRDKEKKWVEKQFYLFSDGWRRPFGLHSLTYNYEIQGRVKKS